MIVQTWEEEQVLVLPWFKINNELIVEICCNSKLVREAIEKVNDRASNQFILMKLECLKHLLLTEYEQYCGNFRQLDSFILKMCKVNMIKNQPNKNTLILFYRNTLITTLIM